MNFNEKLINLRKGKGISQEELGSELNTSRQTISKWELGTSYPDFNRLVLLSDYFGLTLDELVKDIEVQDVRDKNYNMEKIDYVYSKVHKSSEFLRSLMWLCIVVFIFLSLLALYGIFFVK